MKEFKPSAHFVSRVMADVRAYEAAKTVDLPRLQVLLSAKVVRYAFSAAGALLGMLNLTRMYLSVFSQAACR
jgi:hypothetical protein